MQAGIAQFAGDKVVPRRVVVAVMVARDPENLGQFADFLELDVQRTRRIDVPEQDDRCRGLPGRMGAQDMLDDMVERAMGVPAEPDILP